MIETFVCFIIELFTYFIIDILFSVVVRYLLSTFTWLWKNISGNRTTFKQCLDKYPW
jgi:hypothetical protein